MSKNKFHVGDVVNVTLPARVVEVQSSGPISFGGDSYYETFQYRVAFDYGPDLYVSEENLELDRNSDEVPS